MPVVKRLAQRHRKPQAETRDEVLLRLAVIDEGMHHADRRLACMQIESHGKRQPFPVSFFGLVHALDLDYRTHRSGLLQSHRLDAAGECLFPNDPLVGVLGAVLAHADQFAFPGDDLVAVCDRLDERGPLPGNATFDSTGVDLYERVRLFDIDG